MSVSENKEDDPVKQALNEIRLENLPAFFEMLSTLPAGSRLKKTNVYKKLLNSKIADNAKYVALELSPVDLAKYAAVAMVMGYPTYTMPLPDFIAYLHQKGFDAQKLTDYAAWAKKLEIFPEELENPEEAYRKWEMQYLEDRQNDMDASKKEHDRNLEAYKILSIEELQKELTFKQREALEYNGILLNDQEKMQQLESQPPDLSVEKRKERLELSSEIVELSFYLKLTRLEVEALSQALQSTRLSDQKQAALSEQKRREEKEASGIAFCKQSMDFFNPDADLQIGQTTDPDDPDNPMTVVSIAVKENDLLSRHCYIREQLAQYFNSKPAIYEWLTLPLDAWTPPLDLGQRLYQLPIGNIVIDTDSYNRLLYGPGSNFQLRLLKEKQRMGALNHTVSAFWNREEPVYYLESIVAPYTPDPETAALLARIPVPSARPPVSMFAPSNGLFGMGSSGEEDNTWSESKGEDNNLAPSNSMFNAPSGGLFQSSGPSWLDTQQEDDNLAPSNSMFNAPSGGLFQNSGPSWLDTQQEDDNLAHGSGLLNVPSGGFDFGAGADRESELRTSFRNLSDYNLEHLLYLRGLLEEQPNTPNEDIYNQRVLALELEIARHTQLIPENI